MLHAIILEVGRVTIALLLWAVVVTVPFAGFAWWGDWQVRRAKRATLHNPKD